MDRAPRVAFVVLPVLAALASASASAQTVLPLRLVDHFPIVVAKIDDQDIPLILNTGDSNSLVLKQSVLDRIKAMPTGKTIKGEDAKGSVMKSPEFLVSRLQLGDAVFTNLIARREMHAPTMPEPKVDHGGELGTGLLKAYEVIVDFPRLTLTLVPHQANDSPSEDCRGISVPFAAKEAPTEPVTKADTDLGALTLWWDTASGDSFVSQKVVQRAHVPFTNEDVTSKRLVLGGTDFGPWRPKWMEMSLPLFFDGVIGHYFFATHVVCMDFPNRRLLLQP